LANGTIQLFGPRRNQVDVFGLLELSIEHLGRCGWMLTDWDRWSMSKRLVPIVQSLKRRREPDLSAVDGLFDQLAMFQERYDIEDLESAMHCLLAARAYIARSDTDIRESEA
jgi:hypothetical protein